MEGGRKSTEDNSETEQTISSLPDFAQIFAFLQLFGNALHLLPVTLKDLEDFFAYEHKNVSYDTNMVHVHWRLVRNVSRSEGIKEWQRTAVKFAKKNGLISESLPYLELDVRTRVKILRLACEDQFEFNASFRKELKDLEMMETPSIGVDADGQRHWLLKDSNFDVRLYGECDYDEEPPAEAQWVELARSLSGLGRYVSSLEARRRRRTNEEQSGDDPAEIENGGKSLEPAEESKMNGLLEENDKDCDIISQPAERMDQSDDSASRDRAAVDNSMMMELSTSQEENSNGLSAEDMATVSMEVEESKNGEKNNSEQDCADGRRRGARRRVSSTVKPKAASQSKERSSGRGRRRKSPQPKQEASPSPPPQDETGCLKCHKDIDYEQMLLCDECDNECHTYCQYPRLWSIPKGKWICPLCSEGHLIDALKTVHLQLSNARERYEKELERKQRSVARLQKSGLLVQNIIEDADSGRRSRRSRKDVNYAELNDVYLPPLGPQDYVGNETIPASAAMPSTRSRARRNNDVYIQEDYLAPRVRSMTSSRRRWRDLEEEEDTSQEEKEDELPERNRTISHSSPTQHRHEGEGLGVITEEDENESRSTTGTPDSAQNESSSPPPKQPSGAVVKKPRFVCLENTGGDDDDNNDGDLSPVDTQVHQSVTRPLPFRQLNVPSSFHTPPPPPPPPPKHSQHATLPQVPPVPLPVPPHILPHYHQRPPTSHHNHHAPFVQAPPLQQQTPPPLPLSGSHPLPLPHFVGGGALAYKPYNPMSSIDPGNYYNNLMKIPPANYRLPDALLCDEEAMSVEERRTVASSVAAATSPALSTVYRSAENKNLSSDQLKQQ